MSQQAVHTRPRMVTGTVPLRRAASRARRSVNRAVHTAAKNAGLSGVHAHLLRHLAGSMALEDGASVAEVAEMLGDTIAEVQKTYIEALQGGRARSSRAQPRAIPQRRVDEPSYHLPAMAEPLDHELKMDRAFEHVRQLDAEIKAWLSGGHHSVRPEGDPRSGTRWLATAERPPRYPIGVLIGDFLHNLRSSLDLLAYSLATAHTSPLPSDFAETSEFPIFGDEDRSGAFGVGHGHFHNLRKNGTPAPRSGLSKIRGWHPDAQAIIEGLQPYKRGNAYRSDHLWLLHDLDRVNKHRLLHTTVASFSGIGLDIGRSINAGTISAGTIRSLAGTVETDTPIAEFPPISPVDPSQPMRVEIQPVLDVAFARGTPGVEEESVLKTLYRLYTHVRGNVVPALTPFL